LRVNNSPRTERIKKFLARNAKDYIVQVKEKKTEETRKPPETKGNKHTRKEHKARHLNLSTTKTKQRQRGKKK
jgi:hypothetical protein